MEDGLPPCVRLDESAPGWHWAPLIIASASFVPSYLAICIGASDARKLDLS